MALQPTLNFIAMCGLPGSGKSTFIDQHGLKPYVISFDEIRLELKTPVLTTSGKMGVVQSPKFLEIAMARIEDRCKFGELIVVDATHTTSDLLITYQEMCSKYGYSFYLTHLSQPNSNLILASSSKDLFKASKYSFDFN